MTYCELSELPVEMCGCAKHRPDLNVRPAPAIPAFGTTIVAKFDGWCSWCKDEIEADEEKITRVTYNEDSGKLPEWIHDYCAKAMRMR